MVQFAEYSNIAGIGVYNKSNLFGKSKMTALYNFSLVFFSGEE